MNIQSIIQWIRRAKLKDWLRLFDRIIPHAVAIMSGMLIVFFLIDRVNKPMAFMTNEFHKRLTFVLALLSIYLAVRRMAYLRAKDREESARRQRPRAAAPAARPTARSERPAPRYDDYSVRRRAASTSYRRDDYGYSSRSGSDYESGSARRRY